MINAKQIKETLMKEFGLKARQLSVVTARDNEIKIEIRTYAVSREKVRAFLKGSHSVSYGQQADPSLEMMQAFKKAGNQLKNSTATTWAMREMILLSEASKLPAFAHLTDSDIGYIFCELPSSVRAELLLVQNLNKTKAKTNRNFFMRTLARMFA